MIEFTVTMAKNGNLLERLVTALEAIAAKEPGVAEEPLLNISAPPATLSDKDFLVKGPSLSKGQCTNTDPHDLEELNYGDLKTLAEKQGIVVPKGTRRTTLLTWINANKPPNVYLTAEDKPTPIAAPTAKPTLEPEAPWTPDPAPETEVLPDFTVTKKEVREACFRLMKLTSQKEFGEFMRTKVKVANLDQIPEEKYGEVYDLLITAIEKEKGGANETSPIRGC